MMNEFVDRYAQLSDQSSLLLEKKWLELTYNSVGDSLYLLAVEPNETYRFVSVNEAFLKNTGFTSEQIIGKQLESIVPPQILERVLGKYREALGDNKTISWEEISDFPSGTRIGEVKVTPMRDETTGNMYLVGAVHDITERKQAEEALKTSEAELRALFAAMTDVICVIDKEGRHLKVAPTNPEILYCLPENIIGKSMHDIFPETTAHLFLNYIQTALTTRSRVNIEYSLNIHERELWFAATIAPMTKDTVIWVARDITYVKETEKALRESENLYRETVENANDIIYTLDLQGRYISVNRAGERITGYTREEIRQMTFADIIAPEYLELVQRKIGQKVDAGGETIYELELLTKDKRQVTVEINSRLIEKEGSPIAVLGIARDISERKRVEEKLDHVEAQLRQSQKLESIGLLAGGIAHDFNNMLTAINGYSDLILRKLTPDDPLRHMVGEIKKAGERAGGLTYQLLAFSRKQILQPKTLNINEIVTDVSKLLKRLIGEDISLKTDLNETLGQVEIDPGQMTQVLMNLAVNSRDAMPDGGKLIVETDNVSLDESYVGRHANVVPGPYVMLAVSDNGIGMEQAVLERVFEPFFTTKAVGEGTGMGLSTVYGIVKQSNGFIWVYSEVGIGSTFRIYLPRVDKESDKLEDENTDLTLPTGTETILLVEDEDAVRELCRQILETCGYQVIEASNGANAIELFKTNGKDIDLLVTDVIMPEMGGRELVEHITPTSPTLKVLYISGYTDKAIVHHGILGEGTNFIHKPFTPEALAGKVRSVLDKA